MKRHKKLVPFLGLLGILLVLAGSSIFLYHTLKDMPSSYAEEARMNDVNERSSYTLIEKEKEVASLSSLNASSSEVKSSNENKDADGTEDDGNNFKRYDGDEQYDHYAKSGELERLMKSIADKSLE